jgi:hypothetical protein
MVYRKSNYGFFCIFIQLLLKISSLICIFKTTKQEFDKEAREIFRNNGINNGINKLIAFSFF